MTLTSLALLALSFISYPSARLVAAPERQQPARSPYGDPRLEQAVSNRLNTLEASLRPEARARLEALSRNLLARLAASSKPPDPSQLVRAELPGQFKGLTSAQTDLLTFYVLASAAGKMNLISKGSRPPQMSDDDVNRLQMAMQHRTKVEVAVSDMLKKVADTNTNIIANLR